MSKFYVCVPMTHRLPDGTVVHSVCIKVENENGIELSIAADNSCGAMKDLGRISMARFDNNLSISPRVGEEVFHVTAEEYLEALADILGYDLKKR